MALLVLDAAAADGSPWTRWLEPAFLLLRDEDAPDAPGTAAVMAKIADVFLTEIVRRYLSGLDDMTVRQIARLVGCENEASLSKAFRRAFGHAPCEYRRQQLAADGVHATSEMVTYSPGSRGRHRRGSGRGSGT